MVANVARPVTARAGRSAGGGRDPILLSKITVPGRPAWIVPRQRITELIDRGLECIGNQLYQNLPNAPLRETFAA
jgi:hypothetical protein